MCPCLKEVHYYVTFTEAQYASKCQKQIVPLKYENYEPSGWLGFMISQLLYYDVQTDEAMTEHLPSIIRAFDKRGVSRRSGEILLRLAYRLM